MNFIVVITYKNFRFTSAPMGAEQAIKYASEFRAQHPTINPIIEEHKPHFVFHSLGDQS